MTRIGLSLLCVLLSGNAFLKTEAAAKDWPQWGGRHRDFAINTKGLAASWPAAGPPRLWSRPLGEGHSSIVASGDRLYTLYRKGEQEVLIALDRRDGKTVWEFAYDAPYKAGKDYSPQFGPGPNSTPLVAGSLVFSVGVLGKLHAVKKDTGQLMWSHDLRAEFNADDTVNGYASSPIAYRDRIILQIGGSGNAVIAFRQKDGKVVWKSQDFTNSPSSPALIRVGRQLQLVALMAECVAGFDPASGKLLWSFAHKTDYGLNVSTPVWGPDNLLFISAAYNNGSRMLRLTPQGGETKVEEVWYTREVRVHFTNAMRIADRIYASSGDFGPVPLTAVDATTGKVVWRDRAVPRANFIRAGEQVIALCQDGTLVLGAFAENGMRIDSKFPLFNGPAWTVPTLVGTTLYARDRHNIVALDLGSH